MMSVRSIFSGPYGFYIFARDYLHMGEFLEEYMYLFCLNSKNDPLAVFEVSHGGLDYSVTIPREIFKRAITINTSAIIIIHNHPSGYCEPSFEDNLATRRIADAGEILGIRLLDHIIIGDFYYSYKEAGKIT